MKKESANFVKYIKKFTGSGLEWSRNSGKGNSIFINPSLLASTVYVKFQIQARLGYCFKLGLYGQEQLDYLTRVDSP